MYLLSPRVLPPADGLPMMFMNKSLHEMGTAFVERLALPLLR